MQHPGNKLQEPVLYFENGVLRVENCHPAQLPEAAARLIRLDPRGNVYRAKASDYAPLLLELLLSGIRVHDQAKAFLPINDLELKKTLVPRPHQKKALDFSMVIGTSYEH